jgi:predicted nucleotidyltransferase
MRHDPKFFLSIAIHFRRKHPHFYSKKVKMNKRRELKEIERILRVNKPLLAKRFKIKQIGLFGSRMRGEGRKKSDLDILVEFYDVISLLDFVALERELSELTGEKVDLVMKSALKPRIGRNILREVMYL